MAALGVNEFGCAEILLQTVPVYRRGVCTCPTFFARLAPDDAAGARAESDLDGCSSDERIFVDGLPFGRSPVVPTPPGATLETVVEIDLTAVAEVALEAPEEVGFIALTAPEVHFVAAAVAAEDTFGVGNIRVLSFESD